MCKHKVRTSPTKSNKSGDWTENSGHKLQHNDRELRHEGVAYKDPNRLTGELVYVNNVNCLREFLQQFSIRRDC